MTIVSTPGEDSSELANRSKHANLQARSLFGPGGDPAYVPHYLTGYALHIKTYQFGEDVGYRMCKDRIKLSNARFEQEMDQMQLRCKREVLKEWDILSRVRNSANPLRHPQPRALDFRDVVYIPHHLAGKPLEEVTYELGLTTGYCGCQRADEYATQNLNRKLTNREWNEKGVPQRLPAPTPETRPGFNPDLNWIPHPHGLGRLNFRSLAAAASKLRQEMRGFGQKEEGLLLRGLER
ncbi:MAG: hypothetical protein M1826_001804 [Phylliscum demangeonii]|nr:MAG: hypothetical protein M1826_001804 [Phylliscum demangeonii]